MLPSVNPAGPSTAAIENRKVEGTPAASPSPGVKSITSGNGTSFIASVKNFSDKSLAAKSNNVEGVGGEVRFSIGVLKKNDNGKALYPPVPEGDEIIFELAPARSSFADKQGQRVPGVGAGLSLRVKANVARLAVPGSKPMIQHMGIGEELTEWVGAFLGTDNYATIIDPDKRKNRSASQSAAELMTQFKKQQEVVLTLRWVDSNHSVEFDHGVAFTGYLRDIRKIEATEQRVYYSLVLSVTNRNDIRQGTISSDTRPFELPLQLHSTI